MGRPSWASGAASHTVNIVERLSASGRVVMCELNGRGSAVPVAESLWLSDRRLNDLALLLRCGLNSLQGSG